MLAPGLEQKIFLPESCGLNGGIFLWGKFNEAKFAYIFFSGSCYAVLLARKKCLFAVIVLNLELFFSEIYSLHLPA
jgi:hypothetical protein